MSAPLPSVAAHCADLTTRTGVAVDSDREPLPTLYGSRWRLPAGLSEEDLLKGYGGLRVAKDEVA